MQRHSFTALNSTFIIDAEYEFVKDLGRGVSGVVVAARHKRSGEGCAIKKINNINTKRKFTRHCLREIKLLRHFRGHKNITCLYDLDIVFQPNGNFDEVYLYEELMEADLHAIIHSGQPLTDAHFQWFIYQTLCGLKYIHSANVLHRDIKPSNLVVNADCELKICDFGLARGYTPGGGSSKSAGSQGFMTEYVAARFYRAPEIMLSFANYSSAIDIWSVGCVLAELLGGKPIFKGRDYVDQLNQILNYLGTPSETTLRRVGSPRAQDYIRSLPIKPRVPFATLYPHANPLAIDILSLMLCFDPARRISCEQALNHPYLGGWHDPEDEPVCETKFDYSFEEEDSIEGMKKLIVEEVNSFRGEVRAQARAAGQIRRQNSLSIPPRDDIISSPALATPNVLPNDLTNQITRDGHDPVASGGFADIHRGTLQKNGDSVKVAIKAIKTYSGDDGDFTKKQKRLRREIKVWLNLRHANVLPLLGTTTGFGRFLAMVCPWMENGTLTSYLEGGYEGLSVVKILVLLNDVASGLEYLHSCSIVHGDLSGSNVLICGNGRAYIADFGLSTLLTELGASTFATSFQARGTLRWAAPELLDLKIPEDGMEEESSSVKPTTQSDVYSFGSVMLQILSGKIPYHYYTRDGQILQAIWVGMKPRRPNGGLVTERRWMFIQRCWAGADTHSRPSSEEIVVFTGAELAEFGRSVGSG